MSFPCRSRVISFQSIPLIEFLIEGLDESGKTLAPLALTMPLTGTGENPGVLLSIPEQGSLTVLLLSICSCHRRTEWTRECPLLTSRTLQSTWNVELEQNLPVPLIDHWFHIVTHRTISTGIIITPSNHSIKLTITAFLDRITMHSLQGIYLEILECINNYVVVSTNTRYINTSELAEALQVP